jgi:hypothetical protein
MTAHAARRADCAQVSPDCSNFDESQAWPLLLDNYVEYVRKQQQQAL